MLPSLLRLLLLPILTVHSYEDDIDSVVASVEEYGIVYFRRSLETDRLKILLAPQIIIRVPYSEVVSVEEYSLILPFYSLVRNAWDHVNVRQSNRC